MRKLILLPVTLPLAVARGAIDGAIGVLRDVLDSEPTGPSAAPPATPTERVATAPAPPAPAPSPVAPVPAGAEPAVESPPAVTDLHDDEPTRSEPTRGEVARRREALREAEADAGGEGGPGAEIRVDEPWPGYDKLGAGVIVDRLIGADAATRAVVRLYEGSHRNRQTIVRATEE